MLYCVSASNAAATCGKLLLLVSDEGCDDVIRGSDEGCDDAIRSDEGVMMSSGVMRGVMTPSGVMRV